MDIAEKKIKKPCKECPFKRVNTLGDTPTPGGVDPLVYIGQSRGPFWLPCHLDKQYDDKNSSPAKVQQCAGAAIFRANAKSPYVLPPEILSLPADHEEVFSSPAEFYSFYKKIPIEQAKLLLTDYTLDMLLKKEMNDINLKHYK